VRLVQTLSAMALCAALAACNSGASSSAAPADAAKAPADAAAAAAAPAPEAAAAPAPTAAPEAAASAGAAQAAAPAGDVVKATEAQLKKGMSYGDFRKAVLAQGWEPVITAQCKQNVVGGAYERICAKNPDRCKVCDDLPELESCSGDGQCLVQFKHAGAKGVLQATAYGEVDRWQDKDSGFGITQWQLAEQPAAE